MFILETACYRKNVLRWLLLAFLTTSLAEIYLLLTVGGVVGVLPTVFLVVFTAVLGAFLMQTQGLATLARIQSSLGQSQVPAEPLVEGALILFAGALLLTPGFLTDTVGFLCLAPLTRRPLARWLLARASFRAVAGGPARPGTWDQPTSENRPPKPSRPRVIEGEFDREDD